MVRSTNIVVGLVLVGLITATIPVASSHASPDASSSFAHPTSSPADIASSDLHTATIKDLRKRIEQDPTQSELHLSLGKGAGVYG